MSLKIRLKLIVIRVAQLLISSVVGVFLNVPKHVAIIMDGNRRYARRDEIALEAGYRLGHDKLMNIMKCCSMLGVRELTVYAFSIENFKRSEHEVTAIMRLAREKFRQIVHNKDTMRAWGIGVRIVGRQELVSAELRAEGARAALATRTNRVLTLNIAFPYTGRDEISRAASHIVDGVRRAELSAEEVDEELVTATLELAPPQLLVRTSGEVRLSDYMLWQVSNTVLHFTDKLWPEFNVTDLLVILYHYTRHAPYRSAAKTNGGGKRRLFLDNLEKARWQKTEKFAAL